MGGFPLISNLVGPPLNLGASPRARVFDHIIPEEYKWKGKAKTETETEMDMQAQTAAHAMPSHGTYMLYVCIHE